MPANWSIEDVQRGYVIYREGDHVAYVPGELLVGGYQQPDYVVYARTPFKWRPPFADEEISTERREEIVNRVVEGLKAQKLKTEVEW
jgi:hypothetical protein